MTIKVSLTSATQKDGQTVHDYCIKGFSSDDEALNLMHALSFYDVELQYSYGHLKVYDTTLSEKQILEAFKNICSNNSNAKLEDLAGWLVLQLAPFSGEELIKRSDGYANKIANDYGLTLTDALIISTWAAHVVSSDDAGQRAWRLQFFKDKVKEYERI